MDISWFYSKKRSHFAMPRKIGINPIGVGRGVESDSSLCLDIFFSLIVSPIIGTIVGRAFLEAAHMAGYFPDLWLAKMLTDTPALFQTEFGWIISGALGILLAIIWNIFAIGKRLKRLGTWNSSSNEIKPHIQPILLIEPRDGNIDFKIELENIGEVQIYNLLISLETSGASEREFGGPNTRTIPVKGKITISIGPIFPIENSRYLNVAMSYTAVEKHIDTVFKSSYRFILPQGNLQRERLYPEFFKEYSGNLNDDQEGQIALFLDAMSNHTGTLAFVIPERRENGNPNKFQAHTDDRTVVVDPIQRRAWFKSISRTGKIFADIATFSEQPIHIVMIHWSDEIAKIDVDGVRRTSDGARQIPES